MKYKHIIFPAILFAAVALVSCENKEGLAKKVGGTWQSVPEDIVDTDSINVSLIRSLEFAPLQDAEGTLVVSAMISVEKYMPQTDSIVSPITVNAAAVASVTGRYEAISYDKIVLEPDASTFSFSVDSAAVSYNYDVLTQNATPEAINLTPQLIEGFNKYLTPVIKASLAKRDTLTNVKLTRTLMDCRIGNEKLTLRLQTPQ
ncbi:MAG: hypothetical protein K2L73_04240 [Muribaculaceae bacterium]|nr:hypothetical protein [Muribaculaceae bacterium]